MSLIKIGQSLIHHLLSEKQDFVTDILEQVASKIPEWACRSIGLDELNKDAVIARLRGERAAKLGKESPAAILRPWRGRRPGRGHRSHVHDPAAASWGEALGCGIGELGWNADIAGD